MLQTHLEAGHFSSDEVFLSVIAVVHNEETTCYYYYGRQFVLFKVPGILQGAYII